MKKYIFITPEGLIYKPNYDSPEPDFSDLEIIPYVYNAELSNALKDLIEINQNKFGNNVVYNFSIPPNTLNKSLWLKDRKTRALMAS